jgi:hypothetical protein
MLKSNFEFEVLVHGSSAKEYYHQGGTYIEGKEGARFSLRMRNNSGSRALFVPTVDGLSIMNGKEGSFKSRGYIVGARDSVTIEGWRTSDDKIAEFFFSSPKQSYAQKMAKGSNIGVIGCAVFKEKEQEWHHVGYSAVSSGTKNIPTNTPDWTLTTSSQNPKTTLRGIGGSSADFGSASLSVSASNTSSAFMSMVNVGAGLGTGFGKDKYSPTIGVTFDREDYPAETFSIYYNTRENLKAMGVEFKKPVYTAPSAFPNEDGYCERP